MNNKAPEDSFREFESLYRNHQLGAKPVKNILHFLPVSNKTIMLS